MKTDIEKLIKAIATDVEAIVRSLMDKPGGGNRSSIKELRNTRRKDDVIVEAAASGRSNAAVVEVIYDSLLEWDRTPQSGKWPPLSDIREWALAKGLPADNGTLNLIRRSIWWNGHAGQSIEEALEREIDKQMDGRWADLIMDAVAKELEKVFG
ncbi:MAG TPA: hypothetical protein DIT04_02240 [Dysgonomonas sp.]|nr:hypothetical protein [Dysgonomonas sp.]